MSLILIVVVLVLLFGGGGFYGHRQGYYGGGGLGGILGLLVIILIVLFLFGGLGGIPQLPPNSWRPLFAELARSSKLHQPGPQDIPRSCAPVTMYGPFGLTSMVTSAMGSSLSSARLCTSPSPAIRACPATDRYR